VAANVLMKVIATINPRKSNFLALEKPAKLIFFLCTVWPHWTMKNAEMVVERPAQLMAVG